MWVLSAPTIQAESAERLCLVTLENCGLFYSISPELLKLGLGDCPKTAWNDMIPKYTNSTDKQLNHRGIPLNSYGLGALKSWASISRRTAGY